MAGREQQNRPKGFATPASAPTGTGESGQERKLPSAQSALDKIEAAQNEVEVMSGSNQGKFRVAGKRVSVVRTQLVDAYTIHGQAQAYVNGEVVDNEYILQAGDTLEFIRPTGVKG